MKKKAIQPGQFVRVLRNRAHGVRFGVVCRVLSVNQWAELEVAVVPDVLQAGDWNERSQYLVPGEYKLAKQATKRGHA